VVPPDIILWDKVNDPMNDGQARLWVSPYLKEPDGTPNPSTSYRLCQVMSQDRAASIPIFHIDAVAT
jgi:hypothetical protein